MTTPAQPPPPAEEGIASLWRTVVDTWNLTIVDVDGRPVTIGSIAVFALLLIIGTWTCRFISRRIVGALARRFSVDEGAAAALQAVVFYVLLVSVVLLALKVVNVPLTVFAVLGGALAIGIGFGSQNIVNNFISGLIILVERPIRVGNLIQLGEIYGTVRHIGARSTRVVTGDNVEILVPNSSFLESNVTNWTLSDDQIRTRITVGVAYGSPVRKVEQLLLEAAKAHEHVLPDPAPQVLFADFGDNALVFQLLVWARIRRFVQRQRIESDLRFRIDELFREAGIVIAFPQRDIHLDTLRPLDVRVLPANTPAPGSV